MPLAANIHPVQGVNRKTLRETPAGVTSGALGFRLLSDQLICRQGLTLLQLACIEYLFSEAIDVLAP